MDNDPKEIAKLRDELAAACEAAVAPNAELVALRAELARYKADLEREHAAMTHYKAEYDAENKRLREMLKYVSDEHDRAKDLLARAHSLLELSGEGRTLRSHIATHLCWAQEVVMESEGSSHE